MVFRTSSALTCLHPVLGAALSSVGYRTAHRAKNRTQVPRLSSAVYRVATMNASEWWRTAVIYQIYPRSFADSTGDGIGDLNGITSRLDALHELGVDAVWLSPFYTSPQHDAGYDVANYCDVDPLFGTLADFDRLLAAAHARDIPALVDLVPNHSSNEHEWFKAALASAPGSLERARYIFRDGKGKDGSEPPNNWQSVFGGPMWTRITEADGAPGQWDLHIFDVSQPDFDWCNDEVRAEFRRILRFWLDRGVDGFRVDVAHGLIKAPGLPDYTPPPVATGSMGDGVAARPPYWGQDGVHEIYRDWRALADEYPGARIFCAEAWVDPLSFAAKWVRPDEMHQALIFASLSPRGEAGALRVVIDESIAAFSGVSAPATWVLSNHDVVRHATRLSLTGKNLQGDGIGPRSPGIPRYEDGLRRARAATLLMLALPGSVYLFQGEELGLPEDVELPDAARQDPTWFRTHGERYGRDGCRVPLPWESEGPSYGFGPTAAAGGGLVPRVSDGVETDAACRCRGSQRGRRTVSGLRPRRGFRNQGCGRNWLATNRRAETTRPSPSTNALCVSAGREIWAVVN